MASDLESLQLRYTFLTVVVAIGVIFATLCISIYAFNDLQNRAESVVGVLGAITGVLGTLAGYVAGQAGKHQSDKKASDAEQRASKAENKLTAVVAKGEKGILEQARDAYPELFKD